jgi:hypothetical protein
MAGRLAVSGTLADYVWEPTYEREEDEEEEDEAEPVAEDEIDEDDDEEEFFDDEDEGPWIPEAARTRLVNLIVTFTGELRRGENVSWTKAALAREGLYDYLVRRGLGDFDRRPRRPEHPLCPDRRTLDGCLSGLLDVFDGLVERAFAVVELLPSWLRFLRARGLLDEKQHKRAFQELSGVAKDARRFADNHGRDPRLGEGLSAWDPKP